MYMQYNDPSYVKMEKLGIMTKLVNERNIDQAGAPAGRRRLSAGCLLRCFFQVLAGRGVPLIEWHVQTPRPGPPR